jgi:hypothetical protein
MKLFENKFYCRSWIESYNGWRTPGRIEKLYCSLEGEDQALFRRICASLPCPKQFMIEHAAEFGWDDGMIERARIFIPRPLPTPVNYFSKPWHCYENCYHKARAEGIYYVEGLMIGPAAPIIHAWNSTDGKNVIDLGQPLQHLNKYFGMIFDTAPPLGHPDSFVGVLGQFQFHAQKKLAQSNR